MSKCAHRESSDHAEKGEWDVCDIRILLILVGCVCVCVSDCAVLAD